jgi:hypothetical protein
MMQAKANISANLLYFLEFSWFILAKLLLCE